MDGNTAVPSLIAELYIESSLTAKVKEGNAVRIKFPSLPPSLYGQKETYVEKLAADSVFINGNSFYIAECPIPEPVLISKKGKSAVLMPGLSAQARIITDKTTVLKMVLKKLDFIN